ncbi:MAG TPA: enoyl-CoA hydratase/isomerase family protein [Stellaceae bacterium]|nr:enoyl-CoA hydratase/isomerase family protein [Stellaceae bacterium]
MTMTVLREDSGGLATLTLNRPEKLNALTTQMFTELRAHIDAIARAPDRIGLVVVRGAGRCFCAGRDLDALSGGQEPPFPQFFADTVERLAELPQPVISVVHGACYTGGLELALAGDMIIAAESARFADTHAKWAITPIWGMTQRLPRRIGIAKAYEMMLTCRTVSGAEAAEIGLANRCVPDDALDATVAALAAEMLENSWFSQQAIKRLVVATDGMPIRAGLAYESHRTEGFGPDMAERLARFATRRRT